MKIVLGVKKFGKIKEANIDISNFTIFVGNNNSGKSYMMQLIYGVLKEIPRINATLKDFFDGLVYVITSEECSICTCTHTTHLSISISSCRLANQMNGVQREEGQLVVWNFQDQHI